MSRTMPRFVVIVGFVIGMAVVPSSGFSQDWHERDFRRNASSDHKVRDDDDDDGHDRDRSRHQDSCRALDTSSKIAVSPGPTAIAAGATVHFSATTLGDDDDDSAEVRWCATIGEIDSEGSYTAPMVTQSLTARVIATSRRHPRRSASATVHIIAPGKVSTTANVQVALYSISPGAEGRVSVQFGLNTDYGLTTWSQRVPQDGGPVSLFVAGMKASTLYHMRGVVQFSDGAEFLDADQLFTTGEIAAAQLPNVVATTTPGMTPQSGVELLDLDPAASPTTAYPVVVTDLSGNVLWGYAGVAGSLANPIKLMPNGHFLINFNELAGDGVNSVLQEVDLGGALIWQMTFADLNAELAAATCSGCRITVVGTHHDFALLPNGHLIVIAATQQSISGTMVTGDVLIDLDESRKPVWLWNEFEHLDVHRHPLGLPDWTHTNAVIYSVDDGNLIVSLRNQNWLLKVDYANGAGAGDILWRLGYQGDFTLLGGTDPTDWFYAQHGQSFASTNTTGKFSLVLFDDGDDRVFPPGVMCGRSGDPPCFYSTVPLLEIDEMAKTAALLFHPLARSYSFFGGNAEVLQNGNVEYCDTTGGPGSAGDIYEITQESGAQTVWHMLIAGQYAYRGQRIPSLYPGVQW